MPGPEEHASSTLPAAGWYADRENPGGQRYWDGQRWTEHRNPESPATTTGRGVPGTPRNPGLLLIWIVLTFNVYWVYWLYQTYKDVRGRAPEATTITPGQAAGFLFIPFFNLYWSFRIVFDLPRAIARMQSRDGLGEPNLNQPLVTGLLAAAFAINFLSAFDPTFLIVGELLFLTGFFVMQRALNAHWERLGAARPASLEVPGTAIAVGGALLLFLSLFLTWFGEFGDSAWEAHRHLDILLALLAVSIGALALLGLLANDRVPFVLVVIMGVVAGVLTLPGLTLPGEFPFSYEIGHYLAPIGAFLAALGALVVLSSSEERRASNAGPAAAKGP